MSAILDYFNVTVVSVAVTFVLTMLFSTKIKDFFAGVPADFRSSMSSIEASVKADVKSYQATLVAKIAPPPPPVVKPPVAPAAPAAPTA